MPKVKLGEVAVECRDVCKSEKAKLPAVGLEHLTPGEIRLSSWSETADNTFAKAFRKGSMLFGRRRAYLKKAALAPFDGICSGDITVIEALPGKLLPELLPFVIQNDAFFDYAVGRSAGSLSPRVKWEHLRNYTFSLPDIDRQHELAGILWAAENTKEAYQHLIAQTDNLVNSQFIEMFGDYVRNPYSLKKQQIGELYNVRSSKRVYQSQLTAEGVPFLKVTDVISLIDTGKYDCKTYISENLYASFIKQGIVPQPGDILMTTRGTIGKCYIVTESDKFYFQDGMISWFQPKTKQILPKFFVQLFASEAFAPEVQSIVNKTTVTYASLEKLSKISLMCPTIKRQTQYISFLEQAGKSKFELQQAIESISALIKSLMQQDFSN